MLSGKYTAGLKAFMLMALCSLALCSCSPEETSGKKEFNPDIPQTGESGEPGGEDTPSAQERLRYIRIVAIAKPFSSPDKGEWVLNKARGLDTDYTAQDIIEMVEELKPHRIERILTGYANENMLVPVREGEEPMTLKEFLNAVMAAGAEGCDIAPKLDLSWLGKEKQAAFFWESAQKLYDMQLDRPIRCINLDCWNSLADEQQTTAEERSAMFKRLRDIGYTEIGVNMTGHVNDNDPEIDYVVFTLKKGSWTVNTTALERVKSWPNIKKVFQYIDYPEPFTTEFFKKLSPDEQADIYAENVVAKQDELGFTYAWPIIQGEWDANAHVTSESGKWKGKTMFEVFKELMYR